MQTTWGNGVVDVAPEFLDLCDLTDEKGLTLSRPDNEFIRVLNQIRAEEDGTIFLPDHLCARLRRIRRRVETEGYPWVKSTWFSSDAPRSHSFDPGTVTRR